MKYISFSLRFFCIALLSLVFVRTSNSQIVFDFEGQPVDAIEDGSLNNLSLFESGVSVDIFRSAGSPFDVVNVNAIGFPDALPASWGEQTLSPFAAAGVADVFVANFSAELNLVSIEAGDFGADFDTITLEAYSGLDGTGSLIGFEQVEWGLGDLGLNGPGDAPALLSVAGSGIRSITFTGGNGGTFANSVYFDNLTVSVVPEPSSAVFVCAAASCLAIRRRR